MALTDKLTAIANAIRSKTGKTGTLTLDEMASEVSNISTGLDDSELALATATEADVLSGLTFYSGDKELKTGALAVSDLYTTRTVSISVGYSDGGRDFSFNAPVVDGYTCIGGGFTDIVHNNGWYFSAANLHCNASMGYGQLKPDGGGTNGVYAIFFYIKNI